MDKAKVVKLLMDSERRYGLIDTLHRTFNKNFKINIGYSKSICDSSIEELALSVRSYNALRRANISTLGDLIEQLNEGTLRNIRNLGTKSFCEIQTKILVFGFDHLSENAKIEFFNYLIDNNVSHL